MTASGVSHRLRASRRIESGDAGGRRGNAGRHSGMPGRGFALVADDYVSVLPLRVLEPVAPSSRRPARQSGRPGTRSGRTPQSPARRAPAAAETCACRGWRPWLRRPCRSRTGGRGTVSRASCASSTEVSTYSTGRPIAHARGSRPSRWMRRAVALKMPRGTVVADRLDLDLALDALVAGPDVVCTLEFYMSCSSDHRRPAAVLTTHVVTIQSASSTSVRHQLFMCSYCGAVSRKGAHVGSTRPTVSWSHNHVPCRERVRRSGPPRRGPIQRWPLSLDCGSVLRHEARRARVLLRWRRPWSCRWPCAVRGAARASHGVRRRRHLAVQRRTEPPT